MSGGTLHGGARHMSASARGSDMIRALCLILMAWCAPVFAQSDTRPLRVVSMNLCTDQLAMLVAGKGQLYAVSKLASDPRSSAMVEQAGTYETNHGLAEEIYLMQPDLVLAGKFSARATVDMLKRLDIPVAIFNAAYSLDDVRARLLQMGAVLGQQTRAAALVDAFDQRLTDYQQEQSLSPRVALYYANGYTSGDKTLAGQILQAAGLNNIAAEAGFASGGLMPLEVLAMANPDTVLTSSPYPAASRADEIKEHPVITALRGAVSGPSLTDHDWICGTPFVLRAIDDMVKLRRTLQDAPQAGQP